MDVEAEANTISAAVRMYSTAVCPYCIQAERFLRAKGVHEIAKVRVDLEPGQRRGRGPEGNGRLLRGALRRRR